MAERKLLEAVKKAKETSEKKNFTQSIDLIMNLALSVKEKVQIEELAILPVKLSRQNKVIALIGGELREEAEKTCDKSILDSDFSKFTSPKQIKKLAKEGDFFIAQANIMPEVAKVFGKYFAPRGKMPNPKFGQIVPPKSKLAPLVEKLRQSVALFTKKSPTIQTCIGDEKMSDEDLFKNAEIVVNLVESRLPRGKSNIKNIIIKTTMGRPVKVE